MPLLLIVALALLGGCTTHDAGPSASALPSTVVDSTHAIATFAGGCFWCMEPPFDKIEGVATTTSGFTGGHLADPTYSQVTAGRTGHAEVVQVVYDPDVVSYERLLEVFWHNIDPLDAGGQFCDRGEHYRSGIFYHNDEQRALAEASLKRLQASNRFDRAIVTEITEASAFYPAGEEHQNFYRKNPEHYQRYRVSCGRDARLEELWGPIDAQ